MRAWLCVALIACKHAEPSGGVSFVELFPQGADRSSPLVIALHGLGGSPENLARLFDGFPVAAEIALPRGLVPEGDGWAWFAWPPGLTDVELGDAIAGADARLWPSLVELAHGRPIVVTGFSQGAVMSFELAAAHPAEIAYALPIAGRLPASRWPHAPAAPVYALHGTADERIEIDLARATVAAFHAAGGRAELRELPGVGHTAAPMRDDLYAHLRAALAR